VERVEQVISFWAQANFDGSKVLGHKSSNVNGPDFSYILSQPLSLVALPSHIRHVVPPSPDQIPLVRI